MRKSVSTKKPRKRSERTVQVSTWAATLNPKKDSDDPPPMPPDFDPVACRYQESVQHMATLLHWHVLVQFRGQKTMHQFKQYLGCRWANCSPVRDISCYREYLEDGHDTTEGPFIDGTLITQGHRTDFERLLSKASEGSSRREIYSDNPGLLRYTGAVEAAITEFAPPPPIRRDVTVFMLWGPTDTGKTHRAMTAYPDAYVVRGPYSEGKSFDGYRGQAVLILDEWRSTQWPMTFMNTLMDVWATPLICRYHNRNAAWNRVIITTNEDPETMYGPEPARDTFMRRLTYVLYCPDRTCHPLLFK